MLEKNNIYLGDCLEVMKKIPDKSIDLIVTDPPYLMNYKTNYRKDKSHEFCSAIQNDFGKKAELMLINTFKEYHRILKNNTAMYCFCNSNRIDFFKIQLEKIFTIKNIIVWVKNNHTAGDLKAAFGKKYEFIILCNKGRKAINGERLTDVWNFKRVSGKGQLHQNEKPIELIEKCIYKHSTESDIILDSFAGSGTTAIACINTNRNYICIEKEEKYYNLSIDRVKNHIQQWKIL